MRLLGISLLLLKNSISFSYRRDCFPFLKRLKHWQPRLLLLSMVLDLKTLLIMFIMTRYGWSVQFVTVYSCLFVCINSNFALIFQRYKFYRMGGRPRPNVSYRMLGNAFRFFCISVLLWQNMTVDHQCQSLFQISYLSPCRFALTSVIFTLCSNHQLSASNLVLKNGPTSTQLTQLWNLFLLWKSTGESLYLVCIGTQYRQQKFLEKSEAGIVSLATN